MKRQKPIDRINRRKFLYVYKANRFFPMEVDFYKHKYLKKKVPEIVSFDEDLCPRIAPKKINFKNLIKELDGLKVDEQFIFVCKPKLVQEKFCSSIMDFCGYDLVDKKTHESLLTNMTDLDLRMLLTSDKFSYYGLLKDFETCKSVERYIKENFKNVKGLRHIKSYGIYKATKFWSEIKADVV